MLRDEDAVENGEAGSAVDRSLREILHSLQKGAGSAEATEEDKDLEAERNRKSTQTEIQDNEERWTEAEKEMEQRRIQEAGEKAGAEVNEKDQEIQDLLESLISVQMKQIGLHVDNYCLRALLDQRTAERDEMDMLTAQEIRRNFLMEIEKAEVQRALELQKKRNAVLEKEKAGMEEVWTKLENDLNEAQKQVKSLRIEDAK